MKRLSVDTEVRAEMWNPFDVEVQNRSEIGCPILLFTSELIAKKAPFYACHDPASASLAFSVAIAPVAEHFRSLSTSALL